MEIETLIKRHKEYIVSIYHFHCYIDDLSWLLRGLKQLVFVTRTMKECVFNAFLITDLLSLLIVEMSRYACRLGIDYSI